MSTAESPCPTLTVPSNLRMLSVARTFVEAVCQARQIDRTTIHAIVLATGEAVTNIVRHAHSDCPEAIGPARHRSPTLPDAPGSSLSFPRPVRTRFHSDVSR